MKWLHLTAAVMLLAACVSDRIADDSLDEIAADYVQMTLEIGEREPGYVDAYYGPPEWRDAATAAPRSVENLARAAPSLAARMNAVDSVTLEHLDQRHRAFLLAQLEAGPTRLPLLQRETLTIADDAQGLIGARPGGLRP